MGGRGGVARRALSLSAAVSCGIVPLSFWETSVGRGDQTGALEATLSERIV
jgi:hypothetical protein